MKKDLVIIVCPPLSLYKEQPTDMSKCELVECPECKLQMWLSEKKKAVIIIEKTLEYRELFLNCYICFTKFITNNPDFFDEHIKKVKL